MAPMFEGTAKNWLLYGVTGHTGRKVLQVAVDRGHRPTIAGRNREEVSKLAERYALPSLAFDLTEERTLREALTDHDLVVNIAGPYTSTAMPLARAALDSGTDYLDVTGELQVIQELASLDEEAIAKNVCLLPGCGFEIVPTDAIAHYLAASVESPDRLELAVCSENGLSAGTIIAGTEVIARGGFVRREAQLTATRLGAPGPNVRFHQGERKTMEAPLPDLVTAWRTTGIRDISTYFAIPPGGSVLRTIAPIVASALSVRPLRRLVNASVRMLAGGPEKTSSEKKIGLGSIWGRVRSKEGVVREAWIRTGEPYQYTAYAVVHAVEALGDSRSPGFQTPASLFGWQFAEEIEGEKIVDRYPL